MKVLPIFISNRMSEKNEYPEGFELQEAISGDASAETAFRRGADHAATWLSRQALTMLAEGKSSLEISSRLSDLAEVLDLWRQESVDLPDLNPWDWSDGQIDDLLKQARGMA